MITGHTVIETVTGAAVVAAVIGDHRDQIAPHPDTSVVASAMPAHTRAVNIAGTIVVVGRVCIQPVGQETVAVVGHRTRRVGKSGIADRHNPLVIEAGSAIDRYTLLDLSVSRAVVQTRSRGGSQGIVEGNPECSLRRLIRQYRPPFVNNMIRRWTSTHHCCYTLRIHLRTLAPAAHH